MVKKVVFWKKKLLIATDNFLPRWDGIARFLFEVIPKLKDDFKITVLAPDFGASPEIKGVKVIKFKLLKKELADYMISKPSLKIIKKEIRDADIVFTNDLGPICFFSIIYAKKYNVDRVAYVHSLEWDLVSKAMGFDGFLKKVSISSINLLARFLYNKCSVLLVPSLELARTLETNRITTDKIIVHMGVDTKKFKPTTNKARAKERIGIPKKKFVFGYVGRLAREKDPLTLLKAFLMLKEKNSLLLVVGSGIKEIEDKFKNRKNVLFVGSVDNVVPYLQAMDVYVLSSLTETSSLSTMEAMSCGIPVITTKVGYLKYYIKEGYNGVFFKKQNPVDLVRKMRLLMKNDDLRAKISVNARKTIVKHYKLSRTIEELKKVFRELL